MALIRAGQAVADSGGGSGGSSDLLESAALTLTLADWEDVNDFNINSTALSDFEQSGTGLLLHPPTGSVYCAARLEDALGADDQCIVAAISIFRTEDGTVAPGISGMLGIAPGNLGAGNAYWYGVAIEGKTEALGAVTAQMWYRENAAIWAGVSVAEIDGVGHRYDMRLALHRVGTTVTAYVIGAQDNAIQVGKRTGVATTAGDVFIRTESTGSGDSRYVRLNTLSTTGLTIEDGRLVAVA